MKSRLIRRTGAVTLLAAVAATALTGCDRGFGAKLTYDDTEKVKVTDIVVSGGSGDVSVTTAAVTETQVRRIVRSDGEDPGKSYSISGTTLKLDTSCGRNCRVSYEIQAPTGVKVSGELRSGAIALVDVGAADVQVTSGDIRLERISGDVTAKASSGNIEVHALGGAATLATTSGNIEGEELTGGKAVRVEATSGNVNLKLRQPASVTAKVTSGNVDLVVPAGAYKLRKIAGSGEVETDFTSDDSATNIIDVSTRSGNVKIGSL